MRIKRLCVNGLGARMNKRNFLIVFVLLAVCLTALSSGASNAPAPTGDTNIIDRLLIWLSQNENIGSALIGAFAVIFGMFFKNLFIFPGVVAESSTKVLQLQRTIMENVEAEMKKQQEQHDKELAEQQATHDEKVEQMLNKYEAALSDLREEISQLQKENTSLRQSYENFKSRYEDLQEENERLKQANGCSVG